MSISAIHIRDLCVKFDGHIIFSGLNLRLITGQKIVLTGRSGSGKTTLLRSLLGFVLPVAGQIQIFGHALDDRSVWPLRTRMSYVAQAPEMADGRVCEVLERPFRFKCNRHLRGNLEQAPVLLERLLLPASLMNQEISVLSGGEKQRIALVLALLLEREILLLDEVSAALDPLARDAVIALLQAQTELTVLAVSHDRDWFDCFDERIELPLFASALKT